MIQDALHYDYARHSGRNPLKRWKFSSKNECVLATKSESLKEKEEIIGEILINKGFHYAWNLLLKWKFLLVLCSCRGLCKQDYFTLLVLCPFRIFSPVIWTTLYDSCKTSRWFDSLSEAARNRCGSIVWKMWREMSSLWFDSVIGHPRPHLWRM